jgi:hypothetical protein
MKHLLDPSSIRAEGPGWFVIDDTLYHRSDLAWDALAIAQSAVDVNQHQPVMPESFNAFLQRKSTLSPAPLATAPAEPVWCTTEDAARRLGIDRGTLDEMYDRAPKDLPGSPVNVAQGKQRRHLRWNPAELDTWMNAFQTWKKRAGRGR